MTLSAKTLVGRLPCFRLTPRCQTGLYFGSTRYLVPEARRALHPGNRVTSMIGNSRGETEIPLDLAEGVFMGFLPCLLADPAPADLPTLKKGQNDRILSNFAKSQERIPPRTSPGGTSEPSPGLKPGHSKIDRSRGFENPLPRTEVRGYTAQACSPLKNRVSRGPPHFLALKM